MKILFVTNVPSPYRVDFFNELGKKCELTVICERKSSAIRDCSWINYSISNFSLVILKGVRFGVARAICPSIIKHLKKNMYDHIVVTNNWSPTGLIAIFYLKIRKIPYEIEGDGGFVKKRSFLKDCLKKWSISGAEKCFSTGLIHDQYYLHYGAKKDNICHYPFSSIKKTDICKAPVTFEQKMKLRKQLDINEKHVVLSIGQFVYRKGFDLLISACDSFPVETGLYIVGGNPTEEYITLKNMHRSENIHFISYQQKDELNKYFMSADVFVLPTREDIWGLVINEAMAHGLPVVTTRKCVAGLELVDYKNGALVECNSVEELANSINYILSNSSIMQDMGKESLERINAYTIENMADAHMKIWI